jgi:hypothetical protein
MKRWIQRWLFWAPRILGILFAGFLSLFAADVFGERSGFWQTVLALTMHMIPIGIVLIALAISRRWEWIGAILFNALGLYYFLSILNHPSWIWVISGPLFLIGVLFLLNGWFKRKMVLPGFG